MPPCNCHHPFPRPEPFSPLPRPGKVPDWGKWIRDRLAEKGALLVFPGTGAFPDPGAGPNLYLAEDTDIVYRWDGAHYQVVFDPDLANDVLEYEDRGHFPETGRHGKLYIAVDTGSLYRWDDTGYAELLPGKADKAVPQAAGNLAALTADGNLADSGKKPADFQPTLTFDTTPTSGSSNPVTSDGIKKAIDAATPEDYAQVKAQVQTNTGDIADIKAVVPSAATERNKLVDTVTMNSSIATNTAHFLGTKSYVTDLGFPQPSSAADVDNDAIATALGGLTFQQTPTNNDYVFVSVNYTPTTDVDEFRRFKFNDTTGTWAYEYTLNNSSFTAAQWAAINSGITAGKVAEIDGKKNNFDVGTGLVETSNTLYAYRGVAGTTTEGETRYTIGPADVGSAVYSWDGSAAISTGKTVRTVNTTIGRIYTEPFPSTVYYDRSAADDIVRPNVIAIDQTVVAKKTDIPAPSTENPAMDGTAAPGTSASYARGDHVHPTDTSRMAASATGSNIPASTGSALTIQQSLEANATAIGSIGNLAEQTAQGLSTHTGNTTIHVTATEKATWNGKQNALTAQQLANIAAVSDALAFDATHSYAVGDPVVYNGTLYTFTTAHTGAWTGSDVSAVDIIARLAGKANDADVVHKTGDETIAGDKTFSDNVTIESGKTLLARFISLGYGFDLSSREDDGILHVCIIGDYGSFITLFPLRDGTLAVQESLAPAFSTSSTYAVGEHVTYNGGLYRCTTAVTTAGAWTGSANWTADTMTDPDAVLDITSQNQLRVVAKDGTLLWAQGYDLASTSSATLACDATNNFTFADGATTQAFTLPTAPTGKVGDFGLDIDNSANTGAATMTLTGLDTTFSVVVPEGESLNDMLAIAAGELARFYITLSTFRVNNLPTWHIVKQVVENGGATV